MNSVKKTASWEQFYRMIHLQFPHAKVYGLRIVGGEISGYARVQHSTLLTREEARERRRAPEDWDAQWRRLVNLCRELQNVVFPEVNFRDGAPQAIHAESASWEFQSAPAANTRPPILGQ